MPVIPPDPWKLAIIAVALYDALRDAIRKGLPVDAGCVTALDECREEVEKLRQSLAEL